MAFTKLTTERGATLATVFGKARGLVNQAIASGATLNFDVDVSDYDLVTIIYSQTGAATGDITVTVLPFEQDEATPAIAPIPVTAGTAVLASGHVAQVIQVNVTGLKGLRIAVKNNNAGAQTTDFVDVLAGVTGTDF